MPGPKALLSDALFVSYAGPDEKWAKWIVWELENSKQHYRCVVQYRDFAPGMNFMQKMRQAAEARCTLALFSKHYFRSTYCEQELDAALTGNSNRLLPIRIASCDPGAFLKNRIYIDLVDKPLDEARRSLLSGTEAYFTSTRQLTGKPRHRQRARFPGPETKNELSVLPMRTTRLNGPLKVLFVAPIVGGLSPRDQFLAMQRSVKKARYPRSITLKSVYRFHVGALLSELNREAPQVFHLSGKQNGGDILIRTENGGLTTVSDMALAGMFECLDKRLQLVIIDTCFSLDCARSIAKSVPFAMGVEGDIYEDDATEFYSVFYQAVASGRSLKDATGQAQTALKLKNVASSRIPQLLCQAGVNPAKVFLVQSSK